MSVEERLNAMSPRSESSRDRRGGILAVDEESRKRRVATSPKSQYSTEVRSCPLEGNLFLKILDCLMSCPASSPMCETAQALGNCLFYCTNVR